MSKKYAENLPECCYSVNTLSGEIILLKRGVSGYFETNYHAPSQESAQVVADSLNKRLGVSKAQEKAMYVGSLMGWMVPGADPQNYNEDGTAKEMPEITQEGIVSAYKARIEALRNVEDAYCDIYESGDFQCDQTGGFPTMLVCNLIDCVAWLEISERMAESQEQIDTYTAMAAEWGFHDCCNAEDFNNLLEELGKDAIDLASIAEDEF